MSETPQDHQEEESSLPLPQSSPASSSSSSPFRIWLFFAALVVGSNFAMQMYSAPVYLHFAEVLNSCDRLQASESLCLDSSSGRCLWIDGRCYFPDYLEVNCSDAVLRGNTTSSSSANTTSSLSVQDKKESCLNHSASGVCRFDEARQQCHHYAGWGSLGDEVGNNAIFASSTTMGGVFGPILFGAVIVPRFGYATALSLCACCSLLSAVLLTAGIERGEFVLWALPRAVGSISSYVSAYFFSHVISDTMADSVDKEEVKVFAVRTMGVSLGCVAFLESLYLYLVAPSRSPEDFEIRSDPQTTLKGLLHVFNIAQYLIALGLFWFAYMVHLELQEQEQGREDGAVESAEPKEEEEEIVVEKIEQQPTFENEVEVEDQQLEAEAEQQQQQPDPEDCCRRDNFLVFLGGVVLAPLILNLSGLSALTVFAPDIVRDVIADPLLAQLCSVALPMPIAAVCGFFLVKHYASPLTVVCFCAIFTEIGTMIVGIAVYEGENGTPLIWGTSEKRAGIAFAGLTCFSFFFNCGAGTLIFAALSQIYSQGGRNLERLRSGSMWSSVALVTLQTAFRFAYPHAGKELGVGQTLVYGFALFGVLAAVAMFVSQKMRSKEDAAFSVDE